MVQPWESRAGFRGTADGGRRTLDAVPWSHSPRGRLARRNGGDSRRLSMSMATWRLRGHKDWRSAPLHSGGASSRRPLPRRTWLYIGHLFDGYVLQHIATWQLVKWRPHDRRHGIALPLSRSAWSRSRGKSMLLSRRRRRDAAMAHPAVKPEGLLALMRKAQAKQQS